MSAVMSGSMNSLDVYPAVLPWRRMFDDMKARGYAYSRQALYLGVGWSTYQRWLNDGAEPAHSFGASIVELHSRICGPDLTRMRQGEAAPRE